MEDTEDHDAVREVNLGAFPGEDEALLVEKLRESEDVISLVALKDDKMVGHILFSPATIEKGDDSFPTLALAPLAVLPEFQRRGIGSQLVEKGLEECRNQGYSIVTVLGHPDYYPRFGFKLAAECGIQSPFEVPIDAFMVLELVSGALDNVNGVLKYSKAFDEIQ